MTEEAFWGLLQRAAEQPGDEVERTDWLVEELTRLPRGQVARFQRLLVSVCHRLDTPGLCAAALVVHGGALVGEARWGFQLWLPLLGRAVVERAVADPDSLADDERVRALAGVDAPAWPGLACAAPAAMRETTGSADLPEVPWPRAVGWPWPRARRALPRLSEVFGAGACPGTADTRRVESDESLATVVW